MTVMRILLMAGLVLSLAAAQSAEPARGSKGMVASSHPVATQAGLETLQAGGNAIDAAVAVGLMLGVVDGHNSGLGGGCFVLMRLAGGEVVAIDGREMAPAAATRDMYVRGGKADPELSQVGALAAAVPGALAAYSRAARDFGRIPLTVSLLRAAEMAEQGFVVDRTYARRMAGVAEMLRKFPSSRAALLRPDGSAWEPGERLRQPDLAATYRSISEQGLDWFYGGPFAEKTAHWMRENGGLLSVEDFEHYRVKLREPIITRYRDFQIVGFPPPSSGGVHVAQILNVLEHFDLAPMSSIDFVHVVTESMKLAFADRAYWLGDSDFAPVPLGLVSKSYAASLAQRIDLKQALDVPSHGTPEKGDFFGKHTTHFSVADSEGNWVACTATVNTSFGCKVVVPGTGVVLNNQMDDFSIQPGVANFFGLVGAEANAVAPGKRPLSSMSPTLVLKAGQPVLSVGAAGGPTIISQTVLNILYQIDLGLPLDQAMARARFHHQWRPDELRIEQVAGIELLEALRRRGHKVESVRGLGSTQAVAWELGVFVGMNDPRNDGRAAGW